MSTDPLFEFLNGDPIAKKLSEIATDLPNPSVG